MTTITARQAAEMMAHSTQFFTVTFIKRTTGEVRKMNCRIGVDKYEKGVGLKYNPSSKNLLPVWERKYDDRPGEECYRMVNLDALMNLTINNQHYDIA